MKVCKFLQLLVMMTKDGFLGLLASVNEEEEYKKDVSKTTHLTPS